jgi:hypothetical protein
MLGAPLLAAVQYHLGIHRVGLNLAPVVIGPAMPLALWLAANALLESIRGWMKASLAVRTAAGLGQCVSSESKGIPSSEQSRQRSVKRKGICLPV